jgi:hypothetical protein
MIICRSSQTSGSALSLIKENANLPIATDAVGANSIAIGSGAQAHSNNSVAIGEHAITRHSHSVVQAAGRFQSSGDAQVGRYILRTHTVNQLSTEAFIDGTAGSVRLVMPDDSTWKFRADIVGHRTDGSDGHAGFVVEGLIYRTAGNASVSLVGRPQKHILSRTDAGWDVNITADTTNGSLKIAVTGQTGKVIRWVAFIETVEVTN